ncbi:unnamed protein product [Schistosoma bovis]|nr:unnamed protein product [Schistosoma bovis]
MSYYSEHKETPRRTLREKAISKSVAQYKVVTRILSIGQLFNCRVTRRLKILLPLIRSLWDSHEEWTKGY